MPLDAALKRRSSTLDGWAYDSVIKREGRPERLSFGKLLLFTKLLLC